jgi:predicted nuclease of predicted toxin-antitoxin system
VKILVDNQLPLALARLLSVKGAECRHVLELNLGRATDGEIWRYASAHGMVLISKDDDFFHLSGQKRAGVLLVWVRLGNCRNPKSSRSSMPSGRASKRASMTATESWKSGRARHKRGPALDLDNGICSTGGSVVRTVLRIARPSSCLQFTAYTLFPCPMYDSQKCR